MKYCPHCMKTTEGEYCQYCGKQTTWEAAAGQLPLGTLLQSPQGNTYQLGAVRGQGGFGITYAAMDLRTSKRVAVKEYFPTNSATRSRTNQVSYMTGQDDIYQAGMRSFLEEAMMLAAVGALPSVVTVLECFEANGTAYLVMEFVDGVPLHHIVNKTGKMPAQRLLPMLPSLLGDLELLHRAGVIHRDISPDNLMLMPDGTLKLLDFGSARNYRDSKAMTMLLKSGFSPVEQYQSRGQGAWTDVYALAATIYYCLTGTIPPSSVDRIDEDLLQRPNMLGAGLSPQQEAALLKALTVQPKGRYASMSEFSRELFQDAAQESYVPPITFAPQESPAPTMNNTYEAATDYAAQTPPKKKGKGLLIGLLAGGAAVVIAAVVAVILLLGGSGGTTADGFVWEETQDGYATISDYKGRGGSIVVPLKVEDLTVIHIENNAFGAGDGITAVEVSGHIEPGELAFSSCTELKCVTLTGMTSVSSAWGDALAMCDSLRCVMLPSQSAASNDVFAAMDESEDIIVCYVGQDFGYGKARSAVVENDVVYVLTDDMYAVAMYMPDDTDVDALPAMIGNREVTIPGVVRVTGFGSLEAEGTTEDGYVYVLSDDGTQCAIVGYEGEDDYLFFPDEIEGVPVRVIVTEAFANNRGITGAWLNSDMTVMERAFAGCTALEEVVVPGSCTLAGSVFDGCSALRGGMYDEQNPFAALDLPSDFKAFEYDSDIGVGTLNYLNIIDDVIYGMADDGCAVLSLPTDKQEITIEEVVFEKNVTWICAEAFEGVSDTVVVNLPEETIFPQEMVYAVEWEFINSDAQYTFSECWARSCAICLDINDIRGSSGVQIQADPDLLRAAMIRAEEINQNFSATRPNGEDSVPLVNSYVGSDTWDTGSEHREKYPEDRFDEIQDSFEGIAQDFAQADSDGVYYDRFAVGRYYGKDPSTGEVTYYLYYLAIA